ncbi:sugar phosphate isomerase/epimerase family protein [Lederbergia citrea]|uniref:Sugar phosphate isomerase/epimerase n=1 Tax=Lederbergia citrea TaxID=2833581 RepID=A0A942UME4_9BACI|nr:sugar phosphate isomerase/epimerase [Lederbergia citrea]MBS4176810.1 sugar phosphate isomerase/epimerase [Lederbergia citrea]MBS4203370.1 sugar phosphate isomerase/epimerase [Lederbergia citrea]MBS4221957.1 sugar phosphate isomerase/epimerase [Lederbergia citrea]
MIKLGVNSVLFRDFDFATAVKHIALSGYDGVEISAIKGMCEHLDLDRWKDQASEIKSIVNNYGLEILSMEVASLDENRLMKAFEAGAEIGIPVINVGPGGKSGVEEDLNRSIEKLTLLSEKAEAFDVTLCAKAHIGNAIDNTPTTLRAIKEITSPAFGIDMDPSHIYRGNENPEEALAQVLSSVKHIHIRDCKGRSAGPGDIKNQACGRGDIDLLAYCKVMVDGNYSGPVCLEVIGANQHSLAEVSIIAAESYGYLNSCLKSLGARVAIS